MRMVISIHTDGDGSRSGPRSPALRARRKAPDFEAAPSRTRPVTTETLSPRAETRHPFRVRSVRPVLADVRVPDLHAKRLYAAGLRPALTPQGRTRNRWSAARTSPAAVLVDPVPELGALVAVAGFGCSGPRSLRQAGGPWLAYGVAPDGSASARRRGLLAPEGAALRKKDRPLSMARLGARFSRVLSTASISRSSEVLNEERLTDRALHRKRGGRRGREDDVRCSYQFSLLVERSSQGDV